MKADELENLTKLKELPIKDILKVSNCLYVNDADNQINTNNSWYICSCSVGDLSLICEECANSCHKHHEGKVKLNDFFLSNPVCKCGKFSHRIPEQLEEKYKSYIEKYRGRCFVSDLMNLSLNKGFYMNEDYIICNFCYNNKSCHLDDQSKFKFIPKSHLVTDMNFVCKCNNHKKEYFLNFSTTTMHKISVNKYISNFNFNIFNKIPSFKQNLFDTSNNKIGENCKGENEIYKIYNEFSLLNLAEAFKKHKEIYKRKMDYLKNYFEKLDLNKFFLNLRDHNLTGKDKNYFYFQALMIKMIFDIHIKSHYIKNNNLFSLDAIINMNPLQRNFFLIESKKFKNFSKNLKNGSFSQKEEKGVNHSEEEFDTFVDLFIDSVLDFSDNYIKQIGTQITQCKSILDRVFLWINKIFKFLIKYNLISNEKRFRYFEIMLDAFTLCSTGQQIDLRYSSYYLLRISFYCFLYKNDECLIRAIKQKDLRCLKSELKDFSFIYTEDSEIICKIFINCINKFDRSDNKIQRCLKFDYVLRKMFDILLSKDDFYKKSLRNLLYNDGLSVQQLLFPEEIINQKNIRDTLELIQPLIKDINLINRAYVDYNINYPNYITTISKPIRNLMDLIGKYLFGFTVDFSKNVKDFYLEILKREEYKKQAIINLQISLRYTQFYQTFYEFFSTYHEIITFYDNKNEYEISYLDDDLLKFLLVLIYISFENNDENFAIFMIFDISHLISIFFKFEKEFYQFLKILNKTYFKKIDGSNTSFADYRYFSNFINSLIKHINLLSDRDLKFKWVIKIMKLLQGDLKYLHIKDLDLLSSYELILKLTFDILAAEHTPSQEEILSELPRYLAEKHEKDELQNNEKKMFNDLFNEKKKLIPFCKFFKSCLNQCSNAEENQSIEVLLLTQILSLLNEIVFNGFYFLNCFKNAIFLNEEFIETFLQNINNYHLPIDLEINLTRYYELFKFFPNFKINESSEILQNVFFTNSEFYLKFNDHYEKQYSFNQIQNILCNPNFIVGNNYRKNLINYRKIGNEINILEDQEQTPPVKEDFNFSKVNFDLNFQQYKEKNIANFCNCVDFLVTILKRFDTNLGKIVASKYSDCTKLIKIFNYYQHCIVRPLYFIINFINDQNVILIEKMSVKELFKILETAVNFLKVTIILYEKTGCFNAKYKEFLKTFSKFDFDVIHKIPLEVELPLERINSLKNYILDFKAEKIKYFEFKEILNIIKETIKLVLLPEDDKKTNDSNESNDESSLENIRKVDNLPEELFEKFKVINKKYDKKKILTFDDNLSLIKALDSSMGNFKARKIIINYLKNKMSDSLTPFTATLMEKVNNFREDYKLYALDIENFRYENSYCIFYLNIILNNDSKKCQNFLSTSYSIESTKSYISSFILYFVFGNFIYELTKFNELDSLVEFRTKLRTKLSFEIISLTLKFLQNLCEGHNKEFQTILFNIYLASGDLKGKLIDSCTGFKNRHRNIMENNVTKDNNTKITQENQQGEYTNRSITSVNLTKNEEEEEKKINENHENNEENLEKEVLKNLNNLNNTVEQTNDVKLLNKQSENDEIDFEDQEFISKTAVKVIHKKEDANENVKLNEEIEVVETFDPFLYNLPLKPTSFPNFIFTCMRIIINNLQHNTDKNCEDILEIYQKYSDLTVEIIQGTPSSNLFNFYKELKDVSIYDLKEKKLQYDNLIFFQFINLSQEIKEILYDFNILDSALINIKYNLFFIFTNILNCENVDHESVKLFAFIFDPKKLIELLAKYLIVIYLKHIKNFSIDSDKFTESYLSCDLDNSMVQEILERFRINNEIYEDEIYKLSAQIFLFITILGEKYGNIEANSILNLFLKEDQKDEDDEEQQEEESPSDNKEKNEEKPSNNKKVHVKKEDVQNTETVLKSKMDLTQQKLVSVKSLNLASKFFKELIKSCEFIIPLEDENKEDDFDWECFDFLQDESDDDDDDEVSSIKDDDIKEVNNDNNKNEKEEDENKEEVQVKPNHKNLKKIYFIVDPKVFLISDTNIQYFFENADRSNPTNKLKYLLISLEDFYIEVKYKLKNVENNDKMKELFKMDYTNVDWANLIFSMTIVFILLGFLNEQTLESWYVFGTLMFLESLQVMMNIKYLYVFYKSKYNFYVTKEKRKYTDVELTTKDILEIYFIKSFLLNDEVYLLNLNIIIGVVVLLRPTFIGLFILQLFTVIKFSPTIQQIVEAFRIRVSQLLNMVGFLAILIYFYANISFFFYSGEFVKSTDSGYDENLCQSLAECSITYFNHGVRSGGGIGDLLDLRSTSSSMYFPRYFLDLVFYITVILLLLNMINGVIVSTFSQIREDSTKKVEDMKNRCYICSIERGDFEKSQISFDKHTSIDHNYITYIQFLIFLKFFNEKDMDSDQSYIISCIKNKDIGCFPIGRALSLKSEIKE